MKKNFITGLVILLPLALTILIVAFIIGFLTNPFVGFIEHFFKGAPWYTPFKGLIHFSLQILMLIFLFFFTVALGFLGKMLFFKSIFSINDYVMHRIPFIKTVYKATQQVIKSVLGGGTKSFKQVVMVPFPVQGAYSIGLVSGSAPSICEKKTGSSLITVFVPTTPNPTSGFLMLYKVEDVIFLDMKTEDAIKYVISCGVVTSDDSLNDGA